MRLTALVLALLFTTCLGAAAAEPGGPITVALLPKKKGIAYFTSCALGAEAAAKELGNVKLVYDGPTDGSPEKAAAMIEKWTLKGVDVIAVSPNDPNVLAPAMKAAMAKGIKVITAANQNAWMEAMKARLAAAYPKLELVAVKPCNEDQKIAFQVAQDLMKAYPDLKGIFGISSVAFPGAAEAVKQAGKSGQVLVTGLSTPNTMKNYVKDGTVKSVVLWNTKDLGYLTVLAARGLVDGTLTAGVTEFKAGTLGTKPVAGDHILLNNLLVFTKDNIDQFDF